MRPVSASTLSDREQSILRAVVQLFILHAVPVGSRVVSRYLEREMQLSPATIRNVMSDLEDAGYISHPHTSAGRMPTDKGYRQYVDSLMKIEGLPSEETHSVLANLLVTPRETVVREATRMLGSLSHHLALIELPQLRDASVQKVDILRLTSDRLLVVIALESDIVRTVSLEWTGILADATLDDVTRHINERLSGRPLSLLATLFPESSVVTQGSNGLVRLFVEQVGRLGTGTEGSTLLMAGTQNLLTLPEFEDPARMRSVIELVENEDVIVHVLGSARDDEGVSVRIGNELLTEQLQDYSLVSTTYRIGPASGSVGLIGPKRMDYSRMISLVQMVSTVLSKTLTIK
ncbi:MAG: heat-inducible transcriptional repressor HrcA [bacterium]|nr:heat-inducible transcriptional repressor HrcA [bacterium]